MWVVFSPTVLNISYLSGFKGTDEFIESLLKFFSFSELIRKESYLWKWFYV